MVDKTNEMAYTSKQIKSSKWLLLLCAAGAAAVDAVIIAMLFIGGITAAAYFICPFILLALDVVYFVISLFFTNFRFKYSLAVWISYVILFTVGLAVGIGLILGGSGTVLTNFALIFWASVHAAAIFCAIIMALLASRVIKNFWVSLVITVLDLAACAAYIVYVLFSGFFGQGVQTRPLVYKYNADTQSYTVTDVLAGRSSQVYIPETFNGKPVTELSFGVLANSSVKEYVFETDVEFVNEEALQEERDLSGKSIHVSKDSANTLRNKLFGYARGDAKANSVALANAVVPEMLDEGEGYVSFTYDVQSFDACKGKVIPVYIGDLNGFNLDAYAAEFSYINHRDSADVGDMQWAYNNGGLILSDISADGKSLFTGSVTENTVAQVTFEKVYGVKVEAGNDTKYDVREKQPDFCYDTLNGNKLDCRYVTEKTAADLLSGIEARKGFELSWGSSASASAVTDLPATLKGLSGNDITLTPVWKLKAPSVKVSTGVEGNRFTYGDNVELASDVTIEAEGVTWKYEWTRETQVSSTLGTDSALMLVHPKVAESGNYSLGVIAGNDDITSLTADTVVNFQISIAKKVLDFSWLLQDFTYNAQEQGIPLHFNTEQVIGNDDLSYEAIFQGGARYDGLSKTVYVKDAGSYKLGVAIDGADSANYSVNPNIERTVYVAKCGVAVRWDGCNQNGYDSDFAFIYTGKELYPDARATGLLGDGELIGGENGKFYGGVRGGKINVGERYVAEAYTANTNYFFTNPTHEFSIIKKDIIVAPSKGAGLDKISAVYGNGVPKSTDYSVFFNGFVEGEDSRNAFKGEEQILFTREVIDANYAVGTYESGVVLSGWTADNYNIIYETSPVTITPRPIQVSWHGDFINSVTHTFRYDSTEKSVTATITNKVTRGNAVDDVDVVLGGTPSATAAGENYEVNVSSLTGADSANYTIAGELSTGYDILKANVTIKADNKTSVYGEEIAPSTAVVTGSIYNEEIAYSLSSPAEKSAVGSYDIVCSLTLENSNYEVTLVKGTYTVTRRPVNIQWNGTPTSIFNNSSKPVTAVSNDFITGDDVDFSITHSNETNAGSYTSKATLTGADAANYKIVSEDTYSFVINKAKVTVIAEDKTITYGDAAAELTARVEGDVYDDGISYTLAPVTNKNHGAYPITFATKRFSANYDCTFVNGTYTIEKLEVQIEWKNYSDLIYNGQGKFVTADITNKVGTDGVTLSVADGSEKNAGTYTARITGFGGGTVADNYKLPESGLTQEYTIQKVKLVYTVLPKQTTYGDSLNTDYELSRSGTVVMGEEKLIEVSYRKAEGLDVGTYDIVGTLVRSTPNYDVTVKNGTYTINKRVVSCTLSPTNSFVYDTAKKTVTVSFGNSVLEKDRQYMIIEGTLEATEVGDYEVTVTIGDEILKNYQFGKGASANTLSWKIRQAA